MSSLQVRLTLSYALVIMLALGVAGVSLYGLTTLHALRGARAALLEQAVEVARSIGLVQLETQARTEAALGAELRRTGLILQLAARLTDAQITLARTDGTVLTSSAGLRTLPRAAAGVVAEAQAAQRPLVRQLPAGEDRPALVAVVPLTTAVADRLPGTAAHDLAVVLVRPVSVTGLAATGLVRSLALAGLVALAVALALGVGLAGSVSLPVRRMGEGARRLAEGDFSARVDAVLPGELGGLAQAFNHMASRLGKLVADLAGQKQLFEAMVAGLGHGLVAVDGEENVVHLNPRAEELLGLPTDSGAGRPLRELHAELGELVGRAAAARRPATGEIAVAGQKVALVVATPMGEGRRGAVALLQDVTAARQLDRMRREFIAAVSHELRTPVTAIQGFLSAIRDGVARDARQQERCLAIIEEETARLCRLIDDLFEYARLESGQVTFRFEPVDLTPALRRAMAAMAALAAREGVQLVAELPSSVGPVLADRDRIVQVVTNLLGNALRFTPEGGRITIRAWQDDENCHVQVSDTGAGIPPGELERIFERFHKGPEHGARRAGGAGLGLAIARHLVEAHGGRIRADSRPGEGSVFTFTLPLAQPHC